MYMKTIELIETYGHWNFRLGLRHPSKPGNHSTDCAHATAILKVTRENVRSKPKTLLESTRVSNEAVNSLILSYLSRVCRHLIDKQCCYPILALKNTDEPVNLLIVR
jgi:hypothetical protein